MRATKKLYLDSGGDTYIYEESADDLHVVVGGAAYIQIDDELTGGRIAIGGNTAPLDYVQTWIGGTATSGGGQSYATSVLFNGSIIGHADDFTYLSVVNIEGSTTINRDATYVANLRVTAPSITETSGNAAIGASIYVANAPTAATTNAAIYVAGGDINLSTIIFRDHGGTTIPTDGTRIWGDNSGAMHLSTLGSVLVDLDTNANGTLSNFAVRGNANTLTMFKVYESGLSLIGDDTNTNMTMGLTINQGANDNQILALKSSDVGHVITGAAGAEADTFGTFEKHSATGGGNRVRGYVDVDGGGIGLMLQGMVGEALPTTDTSSSNAGVVVDVRVTDGSTGIASPAATGNVFAVQSGGSTRFLVKGNGDVHQTTDAHTALDSWDDNNLLRAYSQVTAPDAIIRDEWDKFVDYNEQDLIAAGVLGKEGKNGLTNTSQLMRLHTGAIWQQSTKHMSLVEEVESLRGRLASAEQQLQALEAH